MSRRSALAFAAVFAIAAARVGAQPGEAGAPAAVDPAAAQAGRGLYTKHCSHCHGFNMVNPGTVSFDLRRFPKDDPDRFVHSVMEGKGAMPAWKSSLTDEQVKLLWAYVRTEGKP